MAYQVANRKCGINLKMIVEVPNLVAIRYDTVAIHFSLYGCRVYFSVVSAH